MDNQPQQLPPNLPDSSNANGTPPQSAYPQNPLPNPAHPLATSPLVARQEAPHVNSSGLIVLQWLTYAFWGWTVLVMSALTSAVLVNFIVGTNDGGFMPYALAAILVLLPISIVCDSFYSKREPVKKTGAASIVMVMHAVLFALFGIAALITVVVCLVQLLTSSSASDYTHVTLYSALIITPLYGAVFLRTLNIPKLKWFHQFFIAAMIIVVAIFSVLAIVGPVATTRITRNDSLIDNNLSTVQSSIDSYVSSNNNLPTNLNNIGLSGDAQKLVTDNLVRYVPKSKPSTFSSSYSTAQSSSVTYYYELCVNYKKSSKSDGGSPYSSYTADNNYSDLVNTYDHPAGNYCYKVSSSTN